MALHPRTALHRVCGLLRLSLQEKLEMCEKFTKPNIQIVSYWNNDEQIWWKRVKLTCQTVKLKDGSIKTGETSKLPEWSIKSSRVDCSSVSPLTSQMFSRMAPRSSSRGTRCFSSRQLARRSDTNLRRLFLRTNRKRMTVSYHRCPHTLETKLDCHLEDGLKAPGPSQTPNNWYLPNKNCTTVRGNILLVLGWTVPLRPPEAFMGKVFFNPWLAVLCFSWWVQ